MKQPVKIVVSSLASIAAGITAGYFIGRSRRSRMSPRGTLFVNYANEAAPELYLSDLDPDFLKKPSGIIQLKVVCIKDGDEKVRK